MKVNFDITEDNTVGRTGFRSVDWLLVCAMACFVIAAFLYRDYRDVRESPLGVGTIDYVEENLLTNGEYEYEFTMKWKYQGKQYSHYYDNEKVKRTSGEQIIYICENGEKAVFADDVKLGKGFYNVLFSGFGFIVLWGVLIFQSRVTVKYKYDDGIEEIK